ncbi:TatD family hydrolase [Sphingopyxis sp. DHUNG17]|uniref:Qat anti-phage system TatD family nuclease QatD n=1 Tax=Sphingopyxis jiangsuensis TaxID=2871171 RepID=UPI00191FFC74|nr:Qat anti-phage system TatD family nuclease QatD [Sphingopyxis lutea]MBL0770030.1 TatD family hydrolase [Sphingopyxis lutea]
MRPELVDFHCHLDLYPNLAVAIEACDRRRTATLAVTTTPRAFPHNQELARNSSFVRVALGLHPQLVGERENELDLFRKLLPETRYVGEVGLDAGPRFYRSFEAQVRVFTSVLQLCAAAGDKVLTVHSVRASKQVLDLIETNLPNNKGRVVLHWFTGSLAEVRRGLDLGCFFSVNEAMLRSPRGSRLLAEIPDDRILTETDGPFVERDGESIGPGDVTQVLAAIATLRGLDPKQVQAQVIKNLTFLLS